MTGAWDPADESVNNKLKFYKILTYHAYNYW